MEKSANKRWKESGSTLTFKEWIDRENKKEESGKNFASFSATNPQDYIKDTLKNAETQLSNPQTQEDTSSVLGLNKSVLVFSGMIIVGAIGIYYFTKLKKKK